MKKTFAFCICLLIANFAFSQNENAEENDLLKIFQEIKDSRTEDNTASEEVINANDHFTKALLTTLKNNPELIQYPFKKLINAHLKILTSSNGKVRLYYWDDNLGGTMRKYRIILQTQPAPSKQTVMLWNDNGPFINNLYTLKSGPNTYYLTSNTHIGSTAVRFETMRAHQLDSNGYLKDARIIKTTEGITNMLGVDLDYSASVNRALNYINTKTSFNNATKELFIPLILGNGKITSRKIVYKFNGAFFEKR